MATTSSGLLSLLGDHSETNSGFLSAKVLYPTRGLIFLQYGHASSPTSLSRIRAEYSPPQVGHIHKARLYDSGRTSSAFRPLFEDHSGTKPGFISAKVLKPDKALILLQ